MVKPEVEGGVRRPFFIGQDLETLCGWWPEAEEAEEAQAILWRGVPMAEVEERRLTFRRRMVEVGPMVTMAEVFQMRPNREWADIGGTEEFFTAG